jgi:acetylornithine/succinyldiaminopimelate/putrescine aminotransferase
LAVVNAIDGKFLDGVAEKGEYFSKKLLAMQGVSAVTGKGLMLGIELAEGSSRRI